MVPPLKVAVVVILSTSAVAVAVAGAMLFTTHHDDDRLHHSSPTTTTTLLLDFLHSSSDVASSWLTPPCLYLLVNGIIISILASAKLQYYSKPTAASSTAGTVAGVDVDVVSSSSYGYGDGLILETDGRSSSSGSGVDEIMDHLDVPPVEKAEEGEDIQEPEYGRHDHDQDMADDHSDGGRRTKEEGREAKRPPVSSSRSVSGRRSGLLPVNRSPTNFTPPHSKGGSSKAAAAAVGLGISKWSRRSDTLESRWKMITEGRDVPLIRHLKKSDTWNSNHVAPPSSAGKVMQKSETFREGRADNNKNQAGATTSSSGKVPKGREPSLSQEELNRRVEAFINNFNVEMRLQRQESLNRYKELLRSGGVFSF